jgi:hypothetical protein
VAAGSAWRGARWQGWDDTWTHKAAGAPAGMPPLPCCIVWRMAKELHTGLLLSPMFAAAPGPTGSPMGTGPSFMYGQVASVTRPPGPVGPSCPQCAQPQQRFYRYTVYVAARVCSLACLEASGPSYCSHITCLIEHISMGRFWITYLCCLSALLTAGAAHGSWSHAHTCRRVWHNGAVICVHLLSAGHAQEPCAHGCPGMSAPVCAEDGQSYMNACVAQCAGWNVVSSGYCTGEAHLSPLFTSVWEAWVVCHA